MMKYIKALLYCFKYITFNSTKNSFIKIICINFYAKNIHMIIALFQVIEKAGEISVLQLYSKVLIVVWKKWISKSSTGGTNCENV